MPLISAFLGQSWIGLCEFKASQDYVLILCYLLNKINARKAEGGPDWDQLEAKPPDWLILALLQSPEGDTPHPFLRLTP